ncbi:HlyC/CorC family transporter [Marinilabiliaceae bacterium JC040]|nr:HlyC/CorC family transporter [Marinilabiliaceae bacterium JC040]
MDSNYLILSIIAMLLASAFFSGMEIAFVSSNKLKIELDIQQNNLISKIINLYSQNPALYITTMLIGNNIALVVYGICMTQLLNPLIRMSTNSEIFILLTNTVISTIIILLTAEFLPKVIFRIQPNLILKIFSLPVFFFYIIFYPISRISLIISNLFISVVLGKKIDNKNNKHVFGKIDLNNLIQEHVDEDNKQEEDSEIKFFINALDFSNVKIRDCMIPRTEITAVELETPISEILQLFTESGYSRILVYKESIDNVIGYVHSALLFRGPKNISDCMTDIIVVPETMGAQKLLKLFTSKHKSIALVIDEFGGTSGMITIEDIMEEIFGEIEDEHDNVNLIEKKISDTEYLLSGRQEIEYINEKFSLKIPESEEYETLAGWILFNYHNLPLENQEIKIDKYRIKIKKILNARIDLVFLNIYE